MSTPVVVSPNDEETAASSARGTGRALSMSRTTGSPRGALWFTLAGAGIAALTLVVYADGIRGEFLGADHALFSRSPLVSPPPAAGEAAPSLPSWLPRATTTITLAADRTFWGPLPAGFRATNLALHIVAAQSRRVAS